MSEVGPKCEHTQDAGEKGGGILQSAEEPPEAGKGEPTEELEL